MTLTREYIEAILSDPPSDTIRAMCELAIEGLELRAENERLLAAMVKARDGLQWSQTHMQEADMRSVSVEVGLEAAEAALERKPR